MIRQATPEDLPALIKMAIPFTNLHDEFRGRFDPEAAASYLLQIMETGVVFIGEKGAIGGAIRTPPFSYEIKFACEYFWWSEGGEGIRLLRRFEKWGKEHGAMKSVITTTDVIGSDASKILDRLGYAATETKHVRPLQ